MFANDERVADELEAAIAALREVTANGDRRPCTEELAATIVAGETNP